MNQKCHHLVFLKILSTVTPECVVDRLRRNNVYIWLLKQINSQLKCQFMQNTFGNTGQKLDAITISGTLLAHLFNIYALYFQKIREPSQPRSKIHPRITICNQR